MNRQQVLQHTKQYFKENNIDLPPKESDYSGLIDFAEFILQKESEEINDFIKEVVTECETQRLTKLRQPQINEVWQNVGSGQKQVVDAVFLMNFKHNPENFQFICRAPHHDADYTYLCNNPYCICKKTEHEIL